MSNLHDFLVEHATFPFPQTNEGLSTGTTDISPIEVPLLEREWKANCAVRDNTLVQKLCNTLDNILGDTLLAADAENQLLSRFSPRILSSALGREWSDWRANPSESHSRGLLTKGVLQALEACLWVYGRYDLVVKTEQMADRGSSRVDYVLEVDGEDGGLFDAKSPSVMNNVGGLLPQNGIELTWAPVKIWRRKCLHRLHCIWVEDEWNGSLLPATITGLCAAFIDDSSVPFRALLGAILSVVEKVPVEPTEFNPNMELDVIVEEQDEGPLPEDDIDDASAYSASSGEEIANDPPNTRNRHRTGQRKAESVLMITSSPQNSPESSQVWIHLHPFSNNMLALPQCAKNGKRRLWLTRFVGFGSTGNVWQCRFDGSVDFFIAKIVEVLRRADANKRQRLHDEFNIYLTLEKGYQSRQLHDRIAPRCYGAFEGDRVAILILDLCDGVLNEWGELSDPERSQVYKLVRDLHRIGITHEDLEPRNIARAHEGGFYLIDFSESRRHTCKGSKCSELQTLRNCLWKRQPLRDVNLG